MNAALRIDNKILVTCTDYLLFSMSHNYSAAQCFSSFKVVIVQCHFLFRQEQNEKGKRKKKYYAGFQKKCAVTRIRTWVTTATT